MAYFFDEGFELGGETSVNVPLPIVGGEMVGDTVADKPVVDSVLYIPLGWLLIYIPGDLRFTIKQVVW